MNRPDTENNSEINGEINCKIDYETQGKLTTYARCSYIYSYRLSGRVFRLPLPSSLIISARKKTAKTKIQAKQSYCSRASTRFMA
ncbi:hypothetical protein [Shewanella baltica]|jgi:hypothetical protein|uniref:hypothetical protein n=1 Tax=Shewanella baltica TaxID=62322 RepID=UPI003D05AF81